VVTPREENDMRRLGLGIVALIAAQTATAAPTCTLSGPMGDILKLEARNNVEQIAVDGRLYYVSISSHSNPAASSSGARRITRTQVELAVFALNEFAAPEAINGQLARASVQMKDPSDFQLTAGSHELSSWATLRCQ
jgi:hypothetical protein